MNISPNFTMVEVVFSRTALVKGIDNTPNHTVMQNVMQAAEGMELVRTVLGNQALHVDSWFRCFELNKLVGGSTRSAHTQGWAVDFVCPSFGRPQDICLKLGTTDIKFDQLICEGTWVHISFAPTLRRQVLTAVFRLGQATTYTEGIV